MIPARPDSPGRKEYIMKEISIKEIEGVRIGQAEDAEHGTGVTVILMPEGAPAGLDVRGGGPASRESELLKPLANAGYIHAVVLGGGSAYGLDAAGGVMRYLEERGYGFDVGVARVPLVCQSDIFDLGYKSASVRPDGAMAYQACLNSEEGNYRDGNYGVGCGATVGKYMGIDFFEKSGIGSYAVQIGEVKIGAIVCVNALGDVYDWKNGEKIAGTHDPKTGEYFVTEDMLYQSLEPKENKFTGNTTIGCIITNAKFQKSQLCKIAGMGHDGMARSIRPIHTTADGDSLYAISTGEVAADQDIIGTLAAQVVSEAITRAVKSARE